MANPIPLSFSPRKNSETDAEKPSDDLVAEHKNEPGEPLATIDQNLSEGGDAGTKGTGSAG